MRGDVWPLPLDRRARAGRSVRWAGRIVPGPGGDYQFAVWGDDQVKLTVGGKTLITPEPLNPLAPLSPSRRSGRIALEAGRPVAVSLEYADAWRESEIRLEWLPPGTGGDDTLERAARAADVVVAWLGPDVPVGRDRTTSTLPPEQEALLQRLVATNPRTVLVLQGPGTVSIPWAAEHVPAILQAWLPGEHGPEAIVDILCGDTNPSGRLPATVYAGDAALGSLDDHDITRGTTYLWMKDAPLFPFGHGLGYSSFVYTNFALSTDTAPIRDTVMVKGDIINTGTRDGDEVVQVYVRDVEASLPQPVHTLRAFRRVTVPAGKRVSVEIPLRIADWGFWDTKHQHWAFETGAFDIQVGASSRDIRWNGALHVR
jgi:beta-glucosidase